MELRSSRYCIWKKGDAVQGILQQFFLKNSFLPICSRYCRALFVRGSHDVIILSGSNVSLQLLLSWYSFLREIGLKTALLTWRRKKKMKHLIRVSEFYLYLIYFNSDFGPWTIVSKEKNITYEMIQNSAWSEDWIKKSTF